MNDAKAIIVKKIFEVEDRKSNPDHWSKADYARAEYLMSLDIKDLVDTLRDVAYESGWEEGAAVERAGPDY